MTQAQALELLAMGENVFLTGQAGSGKTYILNKYVRFLKKNNIPVAITATTGIAATHIGGITIHSWSGIGIKNSLTPKQLSQILKNPRTQSQIKDAKVLVIDEISMLHSYRLDMVNKICKFVRHSEEPFGGLQVILCGDFFQLPPITEEDFQKSSFAFKAEAWAELNLKICYLTEQHRQQDEEFLQVLNGIRSQDLSERTFELLSSRLNKPIESTITPTKLYTHNTDVDAINNLELSYINSPQKQFAMYTKGEKKLVETLMKGCLAPAELILKVGASVMFVKNNKQKGYINGTLATVVGFDKEDGYPIVKTHSGREITAAPQSWILEDNEIILAEISQIPLRLAWAITVHKSQGMSLDMAVIDLSKSFALGMGYVALSRVRTLSGIKLLGINQMAFRVDAEVSELDFELKEMSEEVVSYLKDLGPKEIKKRQEAYIAGILPEDFNPKSKESAISEIFTKFFG